MAEAMTQPTRAERLAHTLDLQGIPKQISREEFDRDWPYATTKIIRDGIAVEKKGRVVGRTIAGIRHYDILFDDRSVIHSIPASDVQLEKVQ